MDITVGIDLGSTTTKAVVLNDRTEVLGRGITNSRSNYDVACQVALREALIGARFELVARELGREGLAGERRDLAISDLTRGFRREQYLAQLEVLRRVLAARVGAERHDPAVGEAVGGILDHMVLEAPELYARGARRKSDFFRDLAGHRYMELAEEIGSKRRCQAGGPSFGLLVGLFDKAILDVENTPAEGGSFRAFAETAARDLGEEIPEIQPAIERAVACELRQVASVGTGYGRQRLPFEDAQIRSEILCHGLGAHAMFPGTRTVLDIGGQDTKAIQIDDRGIVTSFQMNDRCAAGCGRYLGYIADEMNLGVHELGPLAQQATRKVKISSTCTVFAGAELRERLSLGEKREDIVAGLHRAIVLRAMSLLARSGGVRSEFTFTGGVAKNPAAVEALAGVIRESYGEVGMNISPDSIYTGALGAALFAHRSLRS